MLLVEDDRVVVETLTTYLEHAGFDVSATGDGVEGLARAQAPDVALVILDWMVPGHERARSLPASPRGVDRAGSDARPRGPPKTTACAGLETGADDYVPKPFSPREVVARVQALLRRSPAATGGTRDRRVRRLWSARSRSITSSARSASAGALVPLTPTEFRLIEALAQHPGRAFTREELMARALRARLRRSRPHRRHARHQPSPEARRRTATLR